VNQGFKAALTARIDAIMNDASFTPQNLTHSRQVSFVKQS
jgi:hypothetical protein